MIEIPLSAVVAIAGSSEVFALELERRRAALEAHRLGKPGIAAPAPDALIDQLICRVVDTHPVIAERKPDQFVIAEYRIVDDTPVAPELQHTLDTLRKTISG
jgi:hypothetical protein